jgi:hypothetical protein
LRNVEKQQTKLKIMCNQVQSVTLQTAVLLQVKEFASTGQSFSVHNITRTIRNKTAQGELEIPEVEVSGAFFRFDIQHAKVKALFDELWRTGVFDPDFSLSRQFNGTYFLYTPSPVSGGAPAGVSVAPQAPLTAGVPTPVAPTIPTASGPISADIAARVSTYLTNCANRNFRPTLRQVQSAIKRNDPFPIPFCGELKDYIENSLGYSVVGDPGSIWIHQR